MGAGPIMNIRKFFRWAFEQTGHKFALKSPLHLGVWLTLGALAIDLFRIIYLIFYLPAAFTFSNIGIDRIWVVEARKRWQAYKTGKLETMSYEQVMERYRAK